MIASQTNRYTAGDTNVVAWDAWVAQDLILQRSHGSCCSIRYPLLTVAMEGNIMLLRFLLNSGANIETKSDMGNTALLYAAQVLTCDVWTCSAWRVTYVVWRVTCDVWRVTCDVCLVTQACSSVTWTWCTSSYSAAATSTSQTVAATNFNLHLPRIQCVFEISELYLCIYSYVFITFYPRVLFCFVWSKTFIYFFNPDHVLLQQCMTVRPSYTRRRRVAL